MSRIASLRWRSDGRVCELVAGSWKGIRERPACRRPGHRSDKMTIYDAMPDTFGAHVNAVCGWPTLYVVGTGTGDRAQN